MSMAVVALTTVQSGGTEASRGERASGRASPPPSSPRRVARRMSMFRRTDTSHPVARGPFARSLIARPVSPHLAPWSDLPCLVSPHLAARDTREETSREERRGRTNGRTESKPNVTYAELWQRPSGKSRPATAAAAALLCSLADIQG